MEDQRLEQSANIISSLVNKSLYQFTEVLITNDRLVFIVDNTLLYDVNLTNITCMHCNVAVNAEVLISAYENKNANNFDRFDGIISDDFLERKISTIISHYDTIRNIKPVVAEDNELRDNNDFENLLNLSASDGMALFRLNSKIEPRSYLVPMFSGFISLNKPDTIGMRIHDMGDGFLLLHITIGKKKINRDVNIYTRIIDLK
jgi:hypothetical protein